MSWSIIGDYLSGFNALYNTLVELGFVIKADDEIDEDLVATRGEEMVYITNHNSTASYTGEKDKKDSISFLKMSRFLKKLPLD